MTVIIIATVQEYTMTIFSYHAVFLSHIFNKLPGAARYSSINQQDLKLRHSANDNKAIYSADVGWLPNN